MRPKQHVETPAARPRGRPRSEAARLAILAAARALLEEGGPGAVTMEAVAARAGVGKPTVYRWWPDRHAVAMAALMATDERERSSKAINSLRDQLRAIATRFASSTGRHVASMIAASDSNSELSKAFRDHFVLARRAEGKTLIEHAIKKGELRADLDLEVTLDLLYGPLFFRLLMGHERIDEAFMERVLSTLLRGIAASSDASAGDDASSPASSSPALARETSPGRASSSAASSRTRSSKAARRVR